MPVPDAGPALLSRPGSARTVSAPHPLRKPPAVPARLVPPPVACAAGYACRAGSVPRGTRHGPRTAWVLAAPAAAAELLQLQCQQPHDAPAEAAPGRARIWGRAGEHARQHGAASCGGHRPPKGLADQARRCMRRIGRPSTLCGGPYRAADQAGPDDSDHVISPAPMRTPRHCVSQWSRTRMGRRE